MASHGAVIVILSCKDGQPWCSDCASVRSFLLTGSDPSKLQIIKKSNQIGGCISFSSLIVSGELLCHIAIGTQTLF